MPPIFPGSRCLPSRETNMSSLSRARVERCFRWPAEQLPHVFIDVRKPRLDLWPLAFRVRLRGRVRSYDFCRCLFPRARPGTARTSRTTGNRGWDDCQFRPKVTFRIEASRRRCAGSGVENTESRRSPPRLLAVETLPQPRSHRAPPVADTFLFPVRNDVGRQMCRRHWARLHGARSVRVVRRRASAKKTGAHQPEGPSAVGPFALRTGQSSGQINRRTTWAAPFSPPE